MPIVHSCTRDYSFFNEILHFLAACFAVSLLQFLISNLIPFTLTSAFIISFVFAFLECRAAIAKCNAKWLE